MALKLFEFQNQFKSGIFDKKIYPILKKTGFLEKLFILLGNLNSTFKAINRSLFLKRFSLNNWRVHFAFLIANELELNSKRAYLSREFTSAFISMNSLLLLLKHFIIFPEETNTKTTIYIKVWITLIDS